MTRATALGTLALVATTLACSAAPGAGDDATEAQVTVVVRVTLAAPGRAAHEGAAAPEGLIVHLLTMEAQSRQGRFTGRTDADGVARIAVPARLAAGGPVPCVALVARGDLFFRSDLFHLTGNQANVEVPVVIHEAAGPAVLPRWTYAALGAIFLVALALVAFRRSDGHLGG